MRDFLIKAQQSYLLGYINRHVANIEILLNNPVGISGVDDKHQDIQEAIEVELGIIADYNDKLEMLMKYFTKPQQTEEQKEEKKS